MKLRIIRPAAREFRPLTALEIEEMRKEWQPYATTGTELEFVRVTKGVETIESSYDSELAAPYILEEVLKAAHDRVDGIIIHCMDDPAFFAARQIVDIPVMGEGLACYVTAVALGDRMSILSPIPGSEFQRRKQLRAYGLEQHLASVRHLNMRVKDLRYDIAALKELVLKEGRAAVEKDGANVLVPGCGEIYGFSKEVSSELGVPLIDPRATVVRFTEMLVSQSISHSKVAYPWPPEKRREI